MSEARAATPSIRTRPVPACPVCAGPGTTLHERLVDRLFDAPGEWRLVKCGNQDCGLLWLDPAPIAEDLPLAYRRYYTHVAEGRRRGPARTVRRWIREAHAASRLGYRVPAAGLKHLLLLLASNVVPGLREGLDRLLMYVPARPGGRLLDVGCGDGRTLEALRDLGWKAEGVDFDPEAIAAATARGVTARLGSIEDQRYPDRTFDAVTMNHVIEHLPDPVGTLRETRRILAPGGTLVLVTPNAAGLGHRHHGASWRGLEPPRHLQVFVPAALEEALRRAGIRGWELKSLAYAADFIDRESRRISTGERGRKDDESGRAFQRLERRELVNDPWAGEELLLVARP